MTTQLSLTTFFRTKDRAAPQNGSQQVESTAQAVAVVASTLQTTPVAPSTPGISPVEGVEKAVTAKQQQPCTSSHPISSEESGAPSGIIFRAGGKGISIPVASGSRYGTERLHSGLELGQCTPSSHTLSGLDRGRAGESAVETADIPSATGRGVYNALGSGNAAISTRKQELPSGISSRGVVAVFPGFSSSREVSAEHRAGSLQSSFEPKMYDPRQNRALSAQAEPSTGTRSCSANPAGGGHTQSSTR
jgi:hypothetical protein